MKIIISRKGFDSASGRVPSPIFSDGSMVSLPIPYASGIPYNQINSAIEGFRSIKDIVEQLAPRGERLAHLDPDLDARSIDREEGWRGIFGQSSGAQTHLDHNLVAPGDLFLFFGLFRRVMQNASGRFQFNPQEARKHVFFGWLRVATRYALPDNKGFHARLTTLPDWAKYHPHVKHPELEPPPNAIYAATCYIHSDPGACSSHRGAQRCLPTLGTDTPGWGIFRRYSDELCLTHPVPLRDVAGKPRDLPSRWRLPSWMDPRSFKRQSGDDVCLTYHNDMSRWTDLSAEHVTMQSVGRGQEFVLDVDHYPESRSWAEELIEANHY